MKKQLLKQEQEAAERTEKSMDAQSLAMKAAEEDDRPVRSGFGGFGGFAAVSESDEDSDVEEKVPEPAKKKKKRNKKKKNKKNLEEDEEEKKEQKPKEDSDEDAFLDSIVKQAKQEKQLSKTFFTQYSNSILRMEKRAFNYKTELKSLFSKALNGNTQLAKETKEE